jgi:hypothetical protein
MPDSSQIPVAVKDYPYLPLKDWISKHPKSNFVTVLSGETYVASHVWTSEVHEVETFGESTVGDGHQKRMSEFLDRNVGVWSEKVVERRAVWSENAFCTSAHVQLRLWDN